MNIYFCDFSYIDIGDVMLRTKALRKIFIATLSLFVLLFVLTITNHEDIRVLKTNLEIEEIAGINISSIYLMNDRGLLVKSKILLDSDSEKEKLIDLVSNLIIGTNNTFVDGLNALIPEETIINDVIVGNKIVTIDFSKDILKVSKDLEKNMVTAIVYSIIELGDYDGVRILVDGENFDKYPNSLEKLPLILDKSIGINQSYNITSREDINKVVVYYLENIDNNLYYVPVTKYLNDDRDKIKIIVEELSSSYIYETNLMSFLNSNVKLLEYREEDNVMYLNFNDYLFDGNDKVLEEVIYSLAYSVFDNYNVQMVMFEVNSEKIGYISINDLPY